MDVVREHKDSAKVSYPHIQGLRGIAVALVLAYHLGSSLVPGGFVGVDVFFAISGFIIVSLLLREHEQTGSLRLVAFYARRARRLLPAASLVALATVVASYACLGFLAGNRIANDARWSSVFLANYHFYWAGTSYFNATDPTSPLLHYWSLGVEEQFYILVPSLVLVAGFSVMATRRLNLRLSLGFAFVILGLASLTLSVLRSASAPTYAYFLPYTRAWELCAGALLALVFPRVSVSRRLGLILSWLGLGLIAYAALGFNGSTSYPGLAALLPVMGALFVITAGKDSPRIGVLRLLSSRPANFLGDRSYSLYLWSFPVVILSSEALARRLSHLEQALLLLPILVLATASYALVENPLRNSRWLRARTWRSLGLASLLIGGVLSLSSLAIALHPGPSAPRALSPAPPNTQALQLVLSSAAQMQRLPAHLAPPLSKLGTISESFLDPALSGACLAPREAESAPACLSGDLRASGTVLLVGDSYAAMWSSAMSEVATAHHLRLVTLSKLACPPWASPGGGDLSHGDPHCAPWRLNTIARINALRPELVVVANARGDLRAPEYRRNVANLAGMNSFLRAIRPSGAKVAILGDSPVYSTGWTGSPPPDCLAQFADQLQRCSMTRSHVDHVNEQYRLMLEKAALTNGASYIKVIDLICAQDRCPVVVAQRPVYFNRSHITSEFSRYLGPSLGERLAPLLTQR